MASLRLSLSFSSQNRMTVLISSRKELVLWKMAQLQYSSAMILIFCWLLTSNERICLSISRSGLNLMAVLMFLKVLVRVLSTLTSSSSFSCSLSKGTWKEWRELRCLQVVLLCGLCWPGLFYSRINKFIYFIPFLIQQIQNIVKPMSTAPYMHLQQPFYPESSDRKRTSSLYNQLSSASRQNLQTSNRQNILNQGLGYPKSNHSISNTAIKQNQMRSIQLEQSQSTKQPQVSKLLAQNSALRQQIQRQKHKYELQMSQLKRNLSYKDELLDDCEKQIVNLKTTYLKLIQQYETFKSSDQTTRKVEKEHGDLAQRSGTVTKGSEGNLIPLSIKTRGSGNGEVGKLSHGLIRGRG